MVLAVIMSACVCVCGWSTQMRQSVPCLGGARHKCLDLLDILLQACEREGSCRSHRPNIISAALDPALTGMHILAGSHAAQFTEVMNPHKVRGRHTHPQLQVMWPSQAKVQAHYCTLLSRLLYSSRVCLILLLGADDRASQRLQSMQQHVRPWPAARNQVASSQVRATHRQAHRRRRTHQHRLGGRLRPPGPRCQGSGHPLAATRAC
jgi:hypothetical protein